MAVEVVFPRLSDDVDEGVLVTWFVEPGRHVEAGDLLASVQVEKADEEVYAPASGTVIELLAGQGDVVAQGAPIARIGEPSEAPSAPTQPGATAAATATAAPAGAPTGTATPVSPAPAGTTVIASPAAKRLARELGVNLTTVTGSGPGGRIVEDDVRRAASAGDGEAASAAVPLDAKRQLMAARLRDWLATTAQFTLTTEVDVTVLASQQPAWTASVVAAVARALRRHPKLTRRWQGDRLVTVDSIDIGVAVALDDGLVAPVIRQADQRSSQELAAIIADLSERARRSALRPDDVSGGVFTVTSLGAYPIDAFTPLLHPPQIGILGVGRARQKPAVVDGRIEPRWLMVLSLTVDHRVVDGAPAAAFLSDVALELSAATVT
ncbi:MAG TPA: dihydrolipoamide acetyltransferase family protein [Acidimicrobiales bacterium]